MNSTNESACPVTAGQALNTDNKAVGGTLSQSQHSIVPPLVQLPPTPLPVIAANIPEALTSCPQWVCWRYTLKGGKWTKPPYQTNGRLADKTNPAHYSDFQTVLAAYEAGRFSGIGFVLTVDDPFVAIDLDHCLDGSIITEEAQGIIESVRSYTEQSPSGNGIRIFVRGTIPRNFKKGIEVYSQAAYLTVTGQRWQS